MPEFFFVASLSAERVLPGVGSRVPFCLQAIFFRWGSCEESSVLVCVVWTGAADVATVSLRVQKVLPSKSIIAGFQRRGIDVRRAVTLCNSSSDSVLARCLDSLQNRRATAVNKAQFNKELHLEVVAEIDVGSRLITLTQHLHA